MPFVSKLPSIISHGLRFLKQNVPELEILEYPTWEEYCRKLEEGWDVVGFSFYGHHTPEVLQMVDEARKRGVEEIWGGNYGVLTEWIQGYFDRIFIGYSEKEVGEYFGRKVKKVVHPPLIQYFQSPFRFKYARHGILYTSRGCPFRCNYCQIPFFCPKPVEIPLESIERVLRYYRDLEIRDLFILDDAFGVLRDHTERVTDLLDEYHFSWVVDTRADILSNNFEEWQERGFSGAIIGLENLNQQVLDDMNKQEDVRQILDLIRKMVESKKSTICFYIIGFENETIDSIKSSVKILKGLNISFTQFFILTPIPGTPLWKKLEKYGIFESDLHKYDGRSLVWNHPHIKPDEMERLLGWCYQQVNSGKFLKHLGGRMSRHLMGLRAHIKGLFLANTYDYMRQRFFKLD